MIVIGITGPTGAGKTTVLSVLKELGGAVVDCDAVYHELLRTSAELQAELKARFGGEIFEETGDLRRKELGAIVFKDEKALADLNAITHRHIIAELDRRIARAEAQGCPAVALDAVALIESGAAQRCRVTVAVTAPEEARLRRIMAREGIGEDYALPGHDPGGHRRGLCPLAYVRPEAIDVVRGAVRLHPAQRRRAGSVGAAGQRFI